MTLHTAKGLEFDTVFLTGCEDGVFPHQRAIAERTGNELAEERRLAYVGITRARKRLYISRAIARSSWGSPQHNPPSRFLNEVPSQLVDWRRTEAAVTSWRNTSATATQTWRNAVGYGASADQPRDPLAGGWGPSAAHHVRHGHGCRNFWRRRQSHGRCGLWILRAQAVVAAVCTAWRSSSARRCAA